MQHCTLHAFEQFGTLYFKNHNEKHPARPGFVPGISSLRATSFNANSFFFIKSLEFWNEKHQHLQIFGLKLNKNLVK